MNNRIYNFEIANLTPSVLAALRSGKYPVSDPQAWDCFLEETCNAERVLAVLEYPAIGIELEMWTASGGNVLEADEDDCDVGLSYFVYLKASDGAWYSDEHADKECEVDFTADDWKAQLEADMSKAAIEHARQHGFSLTEPNATRKVTDIIYYWYHHGLVTREDRNAINNAVINHDFELFNRFRDKYQISKDNNPEGWTFFPDEVFVCYDDDSYEHLPLEDNFDRITCSEYECG